MRPQPGTRPSPGLALPPTADITPSVPAARYQPGNANDFAARNAVDPPQRRDTRLRFVAPIATRRRAARHRGCHRACYAVAPE
ncbi:MAG: hypothetical protein R2873_10160 [Caldilineaceae bacterium]